MGTRDRRMFAIMWSYALSRINVYVYIGKSFANYTFFIHIGPKWLPAGMKIRQMELYSLGVSSLHTATYIDVS